MHALGRLSEVIPSGSSLSSGMGSYCLLGLLARDRDSFLFQRDYAPFGDKLISFGGVESLIVGFLVCGGRFCTNLVYETLRVPNPTYPWMRIIWRPFIPPKFSFTLWLSCRKRLATRDSLRFMNLDDVSCVFCRNEDETQHHLFFSCPFTSAIWCTIRTWLGIRRQMTTLESAIKWIKKEHGRVFVRAVILAFFIDYGSKSPEIWRARSRRAIKNPRPGSASLLGSRQL
ncbi:hypothetical protein Leryth_027441 [Lithospermum erythrorhizon]|nr:hypothetical protein Leryth_027441 [Lithospermum erythrorhizon]